MMRRLLVLALWLLAAPVFAQGPGGGDAVFNTVVVSTATTLGGTILSDLLFTDATYDIGKSGATRPRDVFTSRNATIGGYVSAGGLPLGITPGDLSASRSSTSGSVFIGTDGAAYIYRASGVLYLQAKNGDAIQLAGGDVSIPDGRLTVSGFGTHSFSASGNNPQVLAIRNANAGATANTQIYLGNDTSATSAYLSIGSVAAGAAFQIFGTDAAGTEIHASNASGAIRFYSGGTTLRASILPAGNYLIGAITSTILNGLSTVDFNSSTYNGLVLNDNASASGSGFAEFAISSTGIGSIARVGSTSAVVYNTTSDRRLKNDLGNATDLSGLRALVIHDFTWKGDPSGYVDRNVFAQEAYGAMPRGVTKGDDDPTVITKTWMVDRSSYVPDLILGWQQHDAAILALTDRIVVLEGR